MRLQPVLITGASTGIGKACALFLSKKGFHVFAGIRKSTDGQALLDETTGTLTPVQLDVTDASSIAAAVERIAAETGQKLYGLVNNAGVSFGGPVECLSIEKIKNLIDVNVVGLFAMTKACLPLLRRNGQGRLINIGSISGLFALPGLSAYAASKHAVEALTDSLRLEMAPFNIAVSVVEPGNVETPIFEKSKSVSDEIKKAADQKVLKLYAPVVDMLNKVAQAPNGMPVQVIADIVFQALTHKKPKTRYLVGKDAKMLNCIGRLPDKLRDRLTLYSLRKMFT